MPARKHAPSKILETLRQHGGSRIKAASELGISLKTLHSNIQILRKRGDDVPESGYTADRQDFLVRQSEAAHVAAPDGFHVRGVSTLYDAEGGVTAQWVKTNRDAEERTRALFDAIKEAFGTAPRIPTIAPPKATESALLTVYPIGDAHFGMHAWGEEAGEDFDLKIAETDLVNAVRRLVRSAPRTSSALIINVGDFFHTNDGTNRTPQSGHVLDVDSRYAKIIRVGLRALRTCIDLALTRHEKVKVVSKGGNHDPTSSVVLQVALAMYYENNPRVEIEQSPAPFVYHEFGKCLIGVTHGDTCKLDKLGGVMAADCPEAWGRTTFHHWYTGHIHQDKVYEGPMWVAESFRTLAAKDGYATRMGYRSGRDMHAIVLHEQWGEIERHRVDISQLKAMRVQ